MAGDKRPVATFEVSPEVFQQIKEFIKMVCPPGTELPQNVIQMQLPIEIVLSDGGMRCTLTHPIRIVPQRIVAPPAGIKINLN